MELPVLLRPHPVGAHAPERPRRVVGLDELGEAGEAGLVRVGDWSTNEVDVGVKLRGRLRCQLGLGREEGGPVGDLEAEGSLVLEPVERRGLLVVRRPALLGGQRPEPRVVFEQHAHRVEGNARDRLPFGGGREGVLAPVDAAPELRSAVDVGRGEVDDHRLDVGGGVSVGGMTVRVVGAGRRQRLGRLGRRLRDEVAGVGRRRRLRRLGLGTEDAEADERLQQVVALEEVLGEEADRPVLVDLRAHAPQANRREQVREDAHLRAVLRAAEELCRGHDRQLRVLRVAEARRVEGRLRDRREHVAVARRQPHARARLAGAETETAGLVVHDADAAVDNRVRRPSARPPPRRRRSSSPR